MSRLKPAIIAALVSLALRGFAVADETEEEPVPDKPTRVEAGAFDVPVRLIATDGVIDSGASWGHSSPWIADVDGDGVKDLVVGDFSGYFNVYRNEGANLRPRYAVPHKLQAGGVDAKVPVY